MVKIKITKAEYPDETGYVGGIYDAFVMDYGVNVEFAAHVDKDKILAVRPENCEVLEEAPESTGKSMIVPTGQILLVEDGSVDTDELAEWCADNGIKLIVYRPGANKPEFLQ